VAAEKKPAKRPKAAPQSNSLEAFQKALEGGHPEQALALLKQGRLSPNAQDEDGTSPLILAARRREDSVVADLLARGARLDLPDRDGGYPIHHAVEGGSLAVTQRLLDAGANVNQKSRSGITPIALALLPGRETLLDFLYGRGATLDWMKDGRNLLSVAVHWNRVVAMKWLLAHGLDANDAGEKERPLTVAAEQGHVEAIEVLLQAGADPRLANPDGGLPLLVAAKVGPLQAVAALLGKGADPNAVGPKASAALGEALKAGHYNAARLLVAKGANLNVRDDLGRSSLVSMTVAGNAEAVGFLLEKGADLTLADGEGLTALDWAMELHRTEVLGLLTQAKAPAGAGPLIWETGLPKAVARATQEGRPIFLDLWAEWCGPCKALQRDVFPAPKVRAALRKVTPLSVMVQQKDGTEIPEGDDLAQRYHLKVYPTLLLLDADGKVLRRSEGALDAEDLVAFMDLTKPYLSPKADSQ